MQDGVTSLFVLPANKPAPAKLFAKSWNVSTRVASVVYSLVVKLPSCSAVCKAEYRAGFQKCSDCGIELVSVAAAEEPRRPIQCFGKAKTQFFTTPSLRSSNRPASNTQILLSTFMRERDWTLWARLAAFWIRYFCSRDDLPEARGILEKLLDIEPNALPYEIHRTAEDSSQT